MVGFVENRCWEEVLQCDGDKDWRFLNLLGSRFVNPAIQRIFNIIFHGAIKRTMGSFVRTYPKLRYYYWARVWHYWLNLREIRYFAHVIFDYDCTVRTGNDDDRWLGLHTTTYNIWVQPFTRADRRRLRSREMILPQSQESTHQTSALYIRIGRQSWSTVRKRTSLEYVWRQINYRRTSTTRGYVVRFVQLYMSYDCTPRHHTSSLSSSLAAVRQ